MNDTQPWEFTCKTCGGHELTVSRVWNILAGPESESWQEWGPLKANHLWQFKFREKIEKEIDQNKDDEVGDGISMSIQKTILLPSRKFMKYSSRRTTRETTSFM